MPPTTTDPDAESIRLTAAELQFAMETNQAVALLFGAISMHHQAIGRAAAPAIASEDIAVIDKLRHVLVEMTKILEELAQPATAAPTVES